MNCLIIRPEELEDDGSVVLTGARLRHVREVLKKDVGETVCAGLLNGPLGEGRIIAMEHDAMQIAFTAGEMPDEQRIDLILAMPRPKVMKRLWSAIASLGVRSITVIGAARVEACYFSSHALDEKVYRPRLIEGLEQVRDTRLPEVRVFPDGPIFIKLRLKDVPEDSLKLLAHPGASSTMREQSQGLANQRVTLAIGPEGGWIEEEIAAFVAAGFTPVTLGPRALRTDTAVIAALTLAGAS
jgi:RsmE family RNA methyltransferase